MATESADTAAVTALPSRRARDRVSRQESRRRIVEAATELVRTHSYPDLSVDAVMRAAGIGRTIFYRHFDDMADLLQTASGEAIQELLTAQTAISRVRPDEEPEALRRAFQEAVDVYERHGPLLRGVAEAAAVDDDVRRSYEAMRGRFDELAERSLRDFADIGKTPLADLHETVRALNRMNENYLLEVFGREPRVSPETAVQTLTEIWDAVIRR
jgi:AcrR family transcriptional regulator